MPDALTQTIPPATLPVNVLKPAAKAGKPHKPPAAKRGKPAKPAKAGKPAPADKAAKLAPLAHRLETRWAAALAAHQEKVRRDFGTLHAALAAGKGKGAKLERLLGSKAKASGRLKDVRRAERALKEALASLKA